MKLYDNQELFENNTRGAIFSTDKKHRFVLMRIWDDDKPKIAFIGLNPSTANGKENDATIERVIEIAKYHGYGGLYMLNLFTYVSTEPDELVIDNDHQKNNRFLKEYTSYSATVVFAWGAFKQAKERAKEVMSLFKYGTYCLKVNKDGSPKHPLYCPKNNPIITYPK